MYVSQKEAHMLRTRLIGLALAMLSITLGSIFAAGPTEAGGGFCQEPTTDARGTNVDLKQNCMVATVLRVDEGATVTFTNRDPIAHTVTGTGSPAGTETEGWFGSFKVRTRTDVHTPVRHERHVRLLLSVSFQHGRRHRRR